MAAWRPFITGLQVITASETGSSVHGRVSLIYFFYLILVTHFLKPYLILPYFDLPVETARCLPIFVLILTRHLTASVHLFTIKTP